MPTDEPFGPEAGQIYYNKDTGWIMEYDGSEWKVLGEREIVFSAVHDIEREQSQSRSRP